MWDKQKLYERLDRMVALGPNWDGFGTEPIRSNAYRIGKRLIEYLPEQLDRVTVLVGVNDPGSLYIEIIQDSTRSLEMTIRYDGTIFWDEVICGTECGSGLFVLSKKKLMQLLEG